LPSHRPRHFFGIDDHKFCSRNAGLDAALFRQHFVEGQATRLGIAACVGHAEFLQLLLDDAVLAERAVQREKNGISLLRQNKSAIPRVNFRDAVPQRAQRFRNARPAEQRDFTLGAWAAQHHDDIQRSGHF
jgi:hypothetical protein